AIWRRSACTPTLWSRVAFIFLSKLYRQMYAGTGISTDSARRRKSKRWARWTARQCKRLFHARPMPELVQPLWQLPHPVAPVPAGAFSHGGSAATGPFEVLHDR
ncbi:MAG TPA: radical SAM protein, partial [Terracidiphilus sp.]|nr:radical SAM protein [Terracidiphilus sp.]